MKKMNTMHWHIHLHAYSIEAKNEELLSVDTRYFYKHHLYKLHEPNFGPKITKHQPSTILDLTIFARKSFYMGNYSLVYI